MICTHVLVGILLYPCNVFANADGALCRAKARQAVGFATRAETLLICL